MGSTEELCMHGVESRDGSMLVHIQAPDLHSKAPLSRLQSYEEKPAKKARIGASGGNFFSRLLNSTTSRVGLIEPFFCSIDEMDGTLVSDNDFDGIEQCVTGWLPAFRKRAYAWRLMFEDPQAWDNGWNAIHERLYGLDRAAYSSARDLAKIFIII